MARIITAQQQPNENRHLFASPSRDMTVSQQVGTLLAISNVMMGFLVNSSEDSKEATSSPTDGGARMAAEATLIKTCDRLDQIISDSKRWGLDLNNSLERKLARVYDAQREFLEEQTVSTKKAISPSFRLSPQLIRLPNGNWAAFIGDVRTNNSVIGIGRFVQEALDNFDLAIEGKKSPMTEEWLKQYEQNMESNTGSAANQPAQTEQSVSATDRTETEEVAEVGGKTAGETQGSRKDRKGGGQTKPRQGTANRVLEKRSRKSKPPARRVKPKQNRG